MVKNIMDPEVNKRIIERDIISNLRKEKQDIDPLLNQMEVAAEIHSLNQAAT